MSFFIYPNVVIIEAYGEDCFKYLQGQFTNDLNKLNTKKPIQLNAICNSKGRVISIFFTAYKTNNSLLLALQKSNYIMVLNHLKKYAIFSKISFKVNKLFKLIYHKNSIKNNSYYDHSIVQNDQDIEISSIPFNHMERINILNKFPIIDSLNTEKFLPAELNLDHFNIISYTKGCFFGQEIIARMKYLGRVKKKLFVMILNDVEKILVKDDIFKDVVFDVINQTLINKQLYILCLANNKPKDSFIYFNSNVKKIKILD